VTRTPLSRSKGQRSRLPGRFTHRGVYAQAGAAVRVGTYWAWETAARLPSADAAVGSSAQGATTPTRGWEGRGISCRHAHSFFDLHQSSEWENAITFRRLDLRHAFGSCKICCRRAAATICPCPSPPRPVGAEAPYAAAQTVT